MIPIVPHNSDGLLPVFRAHGAMVVRGMFNKAEAAGLRAKIAAGYQHADWTERHVEGALPRRLLMRRTGGPVLRAVWRRLGKFRNFLAGQPETWALDGPQDGWYTDTRLNLYPKGGGYMSSHSDAAYVGAEPPGGFAQPLLLLSQKWEHFEIGGGYVEFAGQRHPTDADIGDVIVYNGHVRHGVLPVDPDAAWDAATLNGRLVAAVTPLQVRE